MSSQRRAGWPLVVIALVLARPVRAESPSREDAPRPAARGGKVQDNAEPVVDVRHLDDEDGWRVAETTNFRLRHSTSRALADAVLRTAERARAAQQRKWFGAAGAAWRPKCHICLFPSGAAYGEATGAPVGPGGGHTDIEAEDGRVFSRRIYLHGERDFLLRGVVPHEVTHAVLAGRFGPGRVPRWADEGMAVLAEARPQIDLHLRQLSRWRDEDALFRARDLLRVRDYPEPRAVGVFYAQSVSLVEFLTRAKGARRFADFVRDGERLGYATSLRTHYGWSYAELDRRWRHHAFGDGDAEASAADGE